MEGVPGDLWEAAKSAGPFGALLMLVMYWLKRGEWLEERKERQKVQKEKDELMERVVNGLNSTKGAIEEITRALLIFDRRHGE